MKKNIAIIKLSFALTFWVIFFGMWSAFAASTVDDPANCSTIVNYSSNGRSTNSTNWTTYTTNSSVLWWYINNINAIGLAASGNNLDWWVCVKDYTVWATKISRKKNLCSSDITSLRTYQKKLFDAYKLNHTNIANFWFNNHEQVWWLQNIMSKVNCHSNKDCKLWVNTISDFLFCNVCKDLWSWWTELDTYHPLGCKLWTTLTENNLCCKPWPTECLAPKITINGSKTKYQKEDKSIPVVVDYSANANWDLTYDFSKIKVIWAKNNEDYKTWNKQIAFTITPDATADKITVDVAEWCAVLSADKKKLCPPIADSVDLDIPCQNVIDREKCSNSSGFWLKKGSTWLNILLDLKCQKWGSVEIPFCPETCSTLKISTCEKDYGSWYHDNNWCCETCGADEKWNGTGCICSKIWQPIPDWKKLVACKRVCDPNTACCWIQLNTVVPFIGDCIEMTTQNSTAWNRWNSSYVNQLNAFPFLMMGLSKILVTVILIFSFLVVIAAWLMMVTWVYEEWNYKKWMDRIRKVIIALILLWSSGLILRLINPSFFGG